MEKILTIIIPTYNMENFLPKALTSLVVEEELMNILEVIVVNDGSKDSSLDIAYAFQKQYPQTFHVINKENGNYGSCVNRGLLEAKGKYIKILDADDSFDNAVFSKYLEKIKTLDVDVIFNDAKLVKPDGTEVAQWIVPVPKYRIYNFFSFPFFPEMHTIAFRTKNLRQIGYWQTEGISYTDQEWVFSPISTVHNAYYCPGILYLYLVGREGQTMTPAIKRKQLNQTLTVLKNMLKVYDHGIYTEESKLWMKSKLMDNMSVIYKRTIIDLRDDKNKELIECDKYIKENHFDFYKESDKCLFLSRKIRYNYGRIWRKNYKVNYRNPIFLLYYFLCKFKSNKTFFQ